MKRIVLVLGCFALAGCGQVREARNAYTNSADIYRACLQARGPNGCATEKALMEADERKFTNLSSELSDTTVVVRQQR